MCLGLAIFGLSCILNDRDFVGSVFFCLALNFKQMSLYYAPAFTFYLLSKCIYTKRFVSHLFLLAVAVLGTFTIVWLPLLIFRPENVAILDVALQILHRIFPVARGLFEDKVANFWCVADLVFKLKRRLLQPQLLQLCLAATCIGFALPVIDLLRRRPTATRFLLALVNCSLSFFLFSYQVHEKTILIPLAPALLLFAHCPLLCGHLALVATFR